MNTVTLRTANADDADLVLHLIRSAFAQYEGLFDPPSGANNETVEKIAGKLKLGGGFIACLNDEAIGAVLYEPRPDMMYLGRLAVLPEYRKQGVAKRLITAVEAEAQTLNLPKVSLGVRTALPQNRAFFESLGYQFISFGMHEGYSEPTFMTLEKPLPSSA